MRFFFMGLENMPGTGSHAFKITVQLQYGSLLFQVPFLSFKNLVIFWFSVLFPEPFPTPLVVVSTVCLFHWCCSGAVGLNLKQREKPSNYALSHYLVSSPGSFLLPLHCLVPLLACLYCPGWSFCDHNVQLRAGLEMAPHLSK